VITGIQALILVGIGALLRKMPATGSFLHHLPAVELLLAVLVLAIVSMTVGLLISALVNSSDKTMPLLVVAVMFQVVLTGGIFPVAGQVGLEQVSWISPSRWGFAAVASTVNLNVIQQTGPTAGSGSGASASPSPSGSPGASGKPSASPGGGSATAGTGPGDVAGPATDPLWDHKSGTWLQDVGLMLVLGLLFSVLTWWRLVKIKPGRRQ
jgi:ABC transport system ATP-binding/permease protein